MRRQDDGVVPALAGEAGDSGGRDAGQDWGRREPNQDCFFWWDLRSSPRAKAILTNNTRKMPKPMYAIKVVNHESSGTASLIMLKPANHPKINASHMLN